MGREAICKCQWAGTTVEVKALLETGELVLRGHLRKRLPFPTLRHVTHRAGRLSFTVAGEPVELFLGPAIAEKWAQAIASPLPTLAKKLGITAETVVHLLGDYGHPALAQAIAQAARISATDCALIVAIVDTPDTLAASLREAHSQLQRSVPIWLVYPKGPGHPLNEAFIRSLLRGMGMMDTKVCAVSPKLTALRFNRQKEAAAR